jgi:hypothetical protein
MKRLVLIALLAGTACSPTDTEVPPTSRSTARLVFEAAISSLPPDELTDMCSEVRDIGPDAAARIVVDELGPQDGDFAVSRLELAEFLAEKCS